MNPVHRKAELLRQAFEDLFDAQLRLELALEHEGQVPAGDDNELRGIVGQLQALRSQVAGLWDATVLQRDGPGE